MPRCPIDTPWKLCGTTWDVGSSGAMHEDSARGGMALERCEGETSRYETARVRSRLMTYPEERSESQRRTIERKSSCECVPDAEAVKKV
jgi:hypothetical protein